MKGYFLTARWNTVISIVLGLVTAIFVIAVLSSAKGPLAYGEKTSFIVLAALGAFLCVKGNSHSATMFGWMNPVYWTNPINIIGMILGVVAVLLVVLTLVGINIPLITGYNTAFLVLAAIIFLKVGLKILFNTRIRAKA
jgi:uncharacterized membrane protein